MNEPKFTKGGWRLDERGLVRGAKCDRVLFTPNYSFEDWHANAQGITAFPDLYMCLREAVVEICSRCGGDDCPHSAQDYSKCTAPDGECFVQRWIKALAKARGEEC